MAAGSCTFFASEAAVVRRPLHRRSGAAALRPLLPPEAALVQRVRGASSSSPVYDLVDPNLFLPKLASYFSSPTE